MFFSQVRWHHLLEGSSLVVTPHAPEDCEPDYLIDLAAQDRKVDGLEKTAEN